MEIKVTPENVQQEWKEPLALRGKATDHIWTMEDGAEPSLIGLRLDSGDSGVVYFTQEQAIDAIECLLRHVDAGKVAAVAEIAAENATLRAELERLQKLIEEVKQEITEEPTIGRTVELLFREPLEDAEAENRELKQELVRLTGERDALQKDRDTADGFLEVERSNHQQSIRAWRNTEASLSQAQQALRSMIRTFEPMVRSMEAGNLWDTIPDPHGTRDEMQKRKGKEARAIIKLAEAALPSDTPGAQAQETKEPQCSCGSPKRNVFGRCINCWLPLAEENGAK